MKLKAITDSLESYAPLSFQESYDNSGLLLGDPDMEITGVLISLDITGEVLDEAISAGCNLVISHHPMVFTPMKKFSGNQPDRKLIIRAIKAELAIYSIHTNIDNASPGLNLYVAEKLGLKNCSVLLPKEDLLEKLVTFCPVNHAEKVRSALFDAGAGQIGNYDQCSFNFSGQGTFCASDKTNPFVGEKNQLHFEDETRIEVIFPGYLKKKLINALIKSHPYEEVAYDIYPLKNTWNHAGSGLIGELSEEVDEREFLQRLKKVTGIPVIRHSGLRGKRVKKIAVCTGSGSFLIRHALGNHADAFLTSDLKYHDFFDPQQQMILADIGHYESEQFVKELICSILIEKFPNFAFLISKINTNPVNYY